MNDGRFVQRPSAAPGGGKEVVVNKKPPGFRCESCWCAIRKGETPEHHPMCGWIKREQWAHRSPFHSHDHGMQEYAPFSEMVEDDYSENSDAETW